MKKIVISEFMESSAVDALRQRYDVVYDPSLVDQPHALADLLRNAHALIVRNRTQVTQALLAEAPQLCVVGRLGVGLDNIDVAACEARDVAVAPATGANTQAVAEYVIATALLMLRGAYLSSGNVANGEWPRTSLSNGREIAGKTLAVIGFGGIGQRVSGLAGALGMTVVGYDALQDAGAACWRQTGVRRVEFDEALAQADVITLHVPLTPQTRHLIDARRLALMKADAVLINTARGGVVDEGALADALHRRALGGAALDVFDREPLPAGSVLAGAPRLILTPHIAGLTAESNVRVSTMVAQRVQSILENE